MKAPIDFFTELENPRIDRCKEHLLEDIVFISIAAVICERLDAGWNNDYLLKILTN